MPLETLLIDCDSDKVPHLAQFLGELCTLTVCLLDRASAKGCNAVDAVVISGGPHLFTDPDHGAELRRRFDFLAGVDGPILGICLGHQALALRAGAKVFRGEDRREFEVVELLAEHPLTAGLGRQIPREDPEPPLSPGEDPEPPSGGRVIKVKTDHCEGVHLPANFELLGSSRDYSVEIMAHESQAVYGVQFHPEVSGAVGERLIENFLSIVSGSARYP